MKTKNKRIKRIKRKRTLKHRGGGGKLSTVKPPKKISPSPPSEKIKKTRFDKNPVSDEWDQSQDHPVNFIIQKTKKKRIWKLIQKISCESIKTEKKETNRKFP